MSFGVGGIRAGLVVICERLGMKERRSRPESKTSREGISRQLEASDGPSMWQR